MKNSRPQSTQKTRGAKEAEQRQAALKWTTNRRYHPTAKDPETGKPRELNWGDFIKLKSLLALEKWLRETMNSDFRFPLFYMGLEELLMRSIHHRGKDIGQDLFHDCEQIVREIAKSKKRLKALDPRQAAAATTTATMGKFIA